MIALTLSERFWAKVCKEGPVIRQELGPCWVWIGGKSKGYGTISIGGRQGIEAGAHRVAWLLETGVWPKPCALHKCDNPSCVRFSHLFEGTHQINANDKTKKGRNNSPTGLNNGRSKLTVKIAKEIRRALSIGISQYSLAKTYGVHKKTIWQISIRKTWKAAL